MNSLLHLTLSLSHRDSHHNAGGVLQIETQPFSATDGGSIRNKMRFIIYVSIDASGSMNETATKRGQPHQTKMDFVHMTMKNMIEYIASQEDENPHAEFYIAIVKFDSSAECTILPCRVTKENKDHIIQTILTISPSGGTNFQKCFEQIARLMTAESQYIQPDESITEDFTKRIHVFLTDGANNEGEKNVQRLTSILNTNTSSQKPASQIMIGYGPDHDSTILQQMCKQFPGSKQWFIDEVEKTGCIFGEILWSAVNTLYTGVKISSNVELYDFTTMTWKNEIDVDDIIYDSSRTFYVRFPRTTESVVCTMSQFSLESRSYTSHVIDKTISSPQTEDTTATLEKELWRLDTIVTIDEALKFLQNIKRLPYNVSVEEKNRLIGLVTTFQEKFLAYVSEKNLNDDPFMIQLADDLFVCISGLMATSIGEMYIAARQVSQIQQRSVTVNDITPLQVEILSSMPLSTQGGDEFYNDSFDHYPPAAPRRSYSGGGGYLDDDISCVQKSPQTPPYITITGNAPTHNQEDGENTEQKENEKIISDLTPSSKGVGSRLRHLSRETIIGMRNPIGMRNGRIEGEQGEQGEQDYAYDGGSDQVFSCHASPGCARIGRILSSQTQPNSIQDRTPTCPF